MSAQVLELDHLDLAQADSPIEFLRLLPLDMRMPALLELLKDEVIRLRRIGDDGLDLLVLDTNEIRAWGADTETKASNTVNSDGLL